MEELTTEFRKPRQPVEVADDWSTSLSGELKLVVEAHKLPLGRSGNVGSEELFPVLGSACRRHQRDLEQYMTYEVGGQCPVDDVFAQRLMLQGCEPLPRRRCKPKTPKGYIEPSPLPDSLWSIPPDSSIIWEPYTCKNYGCLKDRWMFEIANLGYSIDQVLATKPQGTVRIGLDLGGGSGTFAARMRERNITIVTTTMNFDGPFNSFIASRGLIPLHISISQRLPFFDNTLDIIHSMHLNATYVPMFDRIGFKKLRWNTGRKVDRGAELNEWYFSALLEKPMT
ncbi:unnamed protein product [Spirodela intermedia]|uniref:Uncharacterized protein n=1 Tax=Spirodela intermedia TaxID=51605 RepID=A0A7I8IQW0_SPIIN|nr:unnamed protein product [Spirodela intermedia]CAA6660251.1 unnamed protein product [Spirodela intermedia]